MAGLATAYSWCPLDSLGISAGWAEAKAAWQTLGDCLALATKPSRSLLHVSSSASGYEAVQRSRSQGLIPNRGNRSRCPPSCRTKNGHLGPGPFIVKGGIHFPLTLAAGLGIRKEDSGTKLARGEASSNIDVPASTTKTWHCCERQPGDTFASDLPRARREPREDVRRSRPVPSGNLANRDVTEPKGVVVNGSFPRVGGP